MSLERVIGQHPTPHTMAKPPADGDECAPAHIRLQPDWVSDLVTLANNRFTLGVNPAIKEIVGKETASGFTVSAPIWATHRSMIACAHVWCMHSCFLSRRHPQLICTLFCCAFADACIVNNAFMFLASAASAVDMHLFCCAFADACIVDNHGVPCAACC